MSAEHGDYHAKAITLKLGGLKKGIYNTNGAIWEVFYGKKMI